MGLDLVGLQGPAGLEVSIAAGEDVQSCAGSWEVTENVPPHSSLHAKKFITCTSLWGRSRISNDSGPFGTSSL